MRRRNAGGLGRVGRVVTPVAVAPQLKCCGMNSSSDWRTFADDGNTVPDSCCVTVATGCGKNKLSDASAVHQRVVKEMPHPSCYCVVAVSGFS